MHTDTKTGRWQIVPTEPTPAMLLAAFQGMVTDMDAMRHAARTKEVAATYARMLAAAPSTGPWQPIETAPKDGTTVLLYPPSWTSRTSSTGSWNSDKHARKPAPYWERDDCWNKVMLSRNSPTTHWMPLPAAPIKGGA